MYVTGLTWPLCRGHFYVYLGDTSTSPERATSMEVSLGLDGLQSKSDNNNNNNNNDDDDDDNLMIIIIFYIGQFSMTWSNALNNLTKWLKISQAEHHNYRNRIPCMHRNRKPCNSLFMVNMASGMDHRCVCPTMTTTTTSCNMVAIFQLITSLGSQCVWYLTSMLYSIDTCQIKVSTDQYNVTISQAQFYGSSKSCLFNVEHWPTACTCFWLDCKSMLG